MEKLSIRLKYCYWIDTFEHEFSFSEWKNVHLIYAQNGTMKTSFTNTFEKLSNWDKPEERVHWNKPEADIKCDWVNNIPKENILAIQSLKEPTSFEKTSTLLARESLRKKYDGEKKKIEEAKKSLDKIMYDLFRKSSYDAVYKELSDAFWIQEDWIDEFFEGLEAELNGSVIWMSSWSRDYRDIFDPKALTEIKTPSLQKGLSWYVKTFQELAKNSNFFRGNFNHTSAEELWNSLKKVWFFDVKHAVTLREKSLDPSKNREADTIEAYTKYLEDDENIFFSTKEMKDEYQKLDKIFKKTGLNNLWSLINNPANSALIPELLNIEEFRRKVIKSVLQDNLTIYNNWLAIYRSVKIELAKIVTEANSDRKEWNNVLSEYKRKFSVPFDIEIWNHSDVMLKWKPPTLIFKHGKKEVDKDLLWKVLSTWERRAFYILNLIFEIETRRLGGKETFIIIDDIADSFDYQNKHAIIEYLKEISQHEKFYILILTHNFDFFRSVRSRLSINRWTNTWMTYKENGTSNIELRQAQNLDPFKELRQGSHKNLTKFICSIPFVRNLVEYSKWYEDDDYKVLTLCLHYKPAESLISSNQVLDVFKKYIIQDPATALTFTWGNIHDLIIQESDRIITGNDDYRIFNKIVLSIWIRLLAEKYMIKELSLDPTDSVFGENDQTWKIYEMYKKLPNTNPLLNQVIIVTPENIHFNAFMYEPIIDMWFEKLKELYIWVRAL